MIDPKLLEAAGVVAPLVGPTIELIEAMFEANTEERQRRANVAFSKLEARAAGKAMRLVRQARRAGIKAPK